MKEKHFWLAIFVILISWGGNYTYFLSKQLDEPIFLKHYYESYITKEGEAQLTFYYLVNKQSPINVQYVRIDGIEFYPIDDGSWTNPDIQQYDQEFKHQYLKSFTINFPRQSLPIAEGSTGPWTFEKMEVGFDTSTVMTVDIGKVNIFLEPQKKPPLEFRMGSSGNDHREEQEFAATEKVKIEDITTPFSELAKNVAIKVNSDQMNELDLLNKDKVLPAWFNDSMRKNWQETHGISLNETLFPFNLEKGEWMRLIMFINPNQHSYLQYSLKIHGTTASGHSFTSEIPITDHPYLEQKDVDEIIAAQGRGK
ncbi:hypothetical protein [Neobacillus sp. PS3-40]|uniref:hypothetical protein n=1 Tax=Neobacillus sp. PS3-40 TaxID=3070679 RepID=UPI0027E0164C|nr:hypothetical protein [Neobacillus sp. PS3-40]WML44431.1 hypothetical protein RCG20_00495 [Neobacillus sp. PS3-40]